MSASIDARNQLELPPRRSGGPRRTWFPVLWPLFLATVCSILWYSDLDPGATNTVINVAVVLGVVGLAAWTLLSSGLPTKLRLTLAGVPCALVLAYYLQLLPIEIINNGDVGIAGVRWRWAEPDRQLSVPKADRVALEWRETPADYPRFLGTGFWAEVRNVQLETDWEAHPPKQLWKQPIGAGWSSYAVVGDYAVTQEQRGDHELVVCYEVRTGKTAWTHSDNVRWDPRGGGALGGVGPRATPTIHDGKVFSHGATGILNCIDAATGRLLWSHDTLAEHNAQNVMWGKAGSPLVVDDVVVVSVGGTSDASLVAYDIAAGEQRWAAGGQRSAYASPILAEVAGVRQIISLNEGYVTSHAADDGQVLWEHEWPSDSNADAAASQPTPIGEDRILLSKGYGAGAELIEVTREGDSWSTTTVWKKPSVLKTKMGNVVVRDGFAYGLNDVYLQCVDLKTGKANWVKRRSPTFGHGQLLLVGDVLLILSESGEVILVEVSPEKYRELGSMKVLEGVTWNNPALAGPYLLVRNAEEAACLELPLKEAQGLEVSNAQ